MTEPRETRERGWPRAAGLLAVTIAASVAQPAVLIALPFLLLVAFLPVRDLGLLLVAALAALFVAGGATDGMWYVERGWAFLVGGWFLGLTLRWPGSGFFPRALGAVAGSFLVAALLFRVRPQSWDVVDWMVMDRMRASVAGAVAALGVLTGPDGVSSELVQALYRTMETEGRLFPALLGLASLAALGVAWWLWVKLARGSGLALRPVRDFRFNDQLVWVFVSGLILVLVGSSAGWDRVGTNALVFMGALYALRGVGVVLFVTGGMSVVGALVVAGLVLFLAPVVAAGALVVGLGDTWLDLRERARAATEPDA